MFCFAVVAAFGFSATTVAVTFTKMTGDTAVTSGGDSRSANLVDYDNDGDLDLFISNGPSGGAVDFLFRNDGGSFTRVAADPVVTTPRSSDGATFGDYDNDGDLDLFVSSWYGQLNLFYANNGDGTFTQITTGSVATDATFSETGSWADYDNDGLLDLYVANSAGSRRNLLYRNTGGGTFARITTGQIVTDGDPSRIGAWADYDNDGDADCYVANEAGVNALYRNDGPSFTRVTGIPPVTDVNQSFGCSWGDYDNDGDLDLFVANAGGENEKLYRNEGGGTFASLTTGPVVTSGGSSVGSGWGDVDNDGDLDLFVCNAFGPTREPNFLFLNNNDGTFTRDLTAPIGTDSGWSYGCAMGDIDRDGDLDIAVARCFAASEHESIYLNDGNANNWLEISCVGVVSNRDAVGARVRVLASIGGLPRWQMREVTSQSGYSGQNAPEQHFGMGDALIADSVIIDWPSGEVTRLTNLPVNQLLVIEECPADTDGDGVRCSDNCPSVSNPLQEDADNDGIGDACCCLGTTGNVDCDPAQQIDIADLTLLVDHLFISNPSLCCAIEGNIDGNGNVDIADLTYLVDHLFINLPALPVCQ